jgi:hypothetical protein
VLARLIPFIIIYNWFMKVLLILWLFPAQLFSQDITGVWAGHMQTGGNEIPYEIVVSQHNNKLFGYSLMTFTINGIENTGIKSIKLINKNGNISIEDEDLIYNDYSTPPKKIKIFSSLSLSINDAPMTLRGSFKTRVIDFRVTENLSYAGTIELVKQNPATKTKLISMLGQMNLLSALSFLQAKSVEKESPIVLTARQDEIEQPVLKKAKNEALLPGTKKTFSMTQPRQISSNSLNPLSFPAINMDSLMNEKIIAAASERKTEVVRSVFFTSDSLVLSLYDNGVVDGDSVSVVMNGKVILANQGLTTKAIRYVIHITPALGDSLLLTMIAENLGSIPPNTGLLIVQDGEQRNEIRFTGDMQMSSAVLFRKKH